jgi:MFS family permease
MNTSVTEINKAERRRTRIAVSFFYFCQGICFATWASRIPDVKTQLDLSAAVLGNVLFALPLGQLLTMPIVGQVVHRFGSKRVNIIAVILYTLAMLLIGVSGNVWTLSLSLLLFGAFGNFCNISVNSQGVAVEGLYTKSVMASFHGVWSLSGLTGAIIGLIVGLWSLEIPYHFALVATLVFFIILTNYKYLVKEHKTKEERKTKTPFFVFPKQEFLLLGIMGFFCMSVEGAMFDWSGVYFKEIVIAPESLVVLGYASFMTMMASGRFISDYLIDRLGRIKLLKINGLLIFTGMGLSVAFPTLVFATIGFLLIGLGVSAVVPIVYSMAGKLGKDNPGAALTSVSSISFFGFLLGPPVIGYIAELSSLRHAYGLIALLGLAIFIMVRKLKV